MIILHHPLQNALVGRHSCQFQIPGYPAKITGKDSPGRPWHMPRPYSIGLKRPTHQSLTNCAFWWDAFMSWGRPWGLLSPSLMELSSKEPPLSREPWSRGPPDQVQWRSHEPLCWKGDLLPHQRSQPLNWLRSQTSWLLLQENQPLSQPGEPAAPPTPQETSKKVEESPGCELPSWTEIHPSFLVTQWGGVPQV